LVVFVKELSKFWIKMDDSHVLSGESVSTDASRKDGDEGKNEVYID
jgi:hypothetical protein